MLIHPIQENDLLPCARIMAQNTLWQRYGVTESSAYQRLSGGYSSGATILVGGEPGEPLGFIWYVEKGAFARSGYILLIGVSPSSQGQGVGDALMQAAEQALFASSSDVFLLVSDFNLDAQRFYARHGYTQVGALPAYVLPDVSELIFRKIRPTRYFV